MSEPHNPTIDDVLTGRSRWAVGNCDGFMLARWLGARAVDHVIGDPPYDEKTHTKARTGFRDPIAIDFDALPPVESFLPALILVAKRWVVSFCSLGQLGEYERAAGPEWIRAGIWHRTDSAPQFGGDRPAHACEGIAVAHRAGDKRWNRHGHQAFWEGPIDRSPRRMHPTKKPLWLMEALVRDFTDPGDLVFDPTMGEGTTGEACIRLGRRFIGCEIDPRYHAAAVRRLTRAARGGVQQPLLSVDAPPVKRPRKQASLFAGAK